VFGGGSAAVLGDFRRLDLYRDGRRETVHARWNRDKGHRGEWAAFARSVQRRSEASIPFEDIVCSTLATLRIAESVATGERISVDTAAFLSAVQQATSLTE